MSEVFTPKIGGVVPITAANPRRLRVVAVAVPDSDPLEIVGPLEVLNTANTLIGLATDRPDLGYDIEVVGLETGLAYAWNGMRLVIDAQYSDVQGPVDTVLVQAIDAQERVLGNAAFLDWLRRQARTARRISSICTGTYALAQAGLLDGRRATTHWAWCENLRQRFPSLDVEADPIYVRDGAMYTSAGGTAGMDLMLAFVEEDFGRELALKVAQFLVVYLKRPGGQAQFSVQLAVQVAERDSIRELQRWMADHLDDDLGVDALAKRVHMSPRNFARVFARETGISPGRYVERLRVEHARQRLEASSMRVSEISDRCGFGTTEAMRQAFVRQVGISPREYRTKFADYASTR